MKTHMSIAAALSLAAALIVAGNLAAEVPPLSPAQRQGHAPLIVTAKVKAVFTCDEQIEAGFVDRKYVVEAAVETVDKGTGLTRGDLIYVRCWEAFKRPEGWAGPAGHSSLTGGQIVWPSDFRRGDRLQFYLERADDRGLDVLSPNGFEVVGRRVAN